MVGKPALNAFVIGLHNREIAIADIDTANLVGAVVVPIQGNQDVIWLVRQPVHDIILNLGSPIGRAHVGAGSSADGGFDNVFRIFTILVDRKQTGLDGLNPAAFARRRYSEYQPVVIGPVQPGQTSPYFTDRHSQRWRDIQSCWRCANFRAQCARFEDTSC